MFVLLSKALILIKYALHGKQILNIRHITHGDKRSLTDAAAAFGIFAHENMAMECATTANFTGTGNFEAFFRGAIGFHFWHGKYFTQKKCKGRELRE
jgi:hypothetical protein